MPDVRAFTHVGLGSFVDPRNGGGKSNECTTDDPVELIEIDGETKLRYRPFKVDYAILRGTYADPRGNVSLEEEAIDMDSYSMALAAQTAAAKCSYRSAMCWKQVPSNHVGSNYREFWSMASLSTANNRKPILAVTT